MLCNLSRLPAGRGYFPQVERAVAVAYEVDLVTHNHRGAVVAVEVGQAGETLSLDVIESHVGVIRAAVALARITGVVPVERYVRSVLVEAAIVRRTAVDSFGKPGLQRHPVNTLPENLSLL